MGLINWIFDIYQHVKLDEVRTEAARARAEAAAIRASGGGVDVDRLERAIGELALAAKTLERMMLEKGICTAEEMAQTLRRVDLEDGLADGKTPIGGTP
jgi:hypothetical protein